MSDLSKYKDYPERVLDGSIPACIYIQKACERYLSFFDKYDFRPEKVDKVIEFISHLKHFQGKSAGKPFILQPWQEWIIYSIFGFYHRGTDRRVCKEADIEITRKNGKTALAAAIGLYCLLGDGEQGAEVDFMSNSVKQAHIAYDLAKYFSFNLDPKRKHLQILRDTIKHGKSASMIQVLATDTAALDGYNSSLTVLDECHAMKTGDLYNVMKSSQGFRTNPLTILITTAGNDMTTWYYTKRRTAIDILYGLKEDDSFFTCIYTLDKDDDFHNEEVWIKACPNLGITVDADYLRGRVTEADNDPQARKEVMVKQFNLWQADSVNQWLPNLLIEGATEKIEWEFFKDKITYLGIDLSSVSDLTSSSFLCKDGDEYYFKTKYYLPEEALKDPNNGSKYLSWWHEKHLTLTPGNVTDYDYILKDILEVQETGMIVDSVSYDSYNATQFAINATAAGLPMKPYPQALYSFNRPTREFERLLRQGHVHLDYNPITAWCFSNTVLKTDWNNNVKPIKKTGQTGDSSYKIDGVITITESLGGYLNSPNALYSSAGTSL